MITQLNANLNERIKKEGCYLLSLGALAEENWNHEFGVNAVHKIYDSCLELGYIDKDCYVLSPDGVLLEYRNEIFSEPQLHGRILQVGINDTYGKRFWNWVKGNKVDFEIACFRTVLRNKHFIFLNKNGSVKFDPNPKCKVDTILYTVYYRWYEGTQK